MKLHRKALALALGTLFTLCVVPAAFSLADAPRGGFAPDPAGVASTTQWVFDIPVRQGVPSLSSARAVKLDKPLSTVRVLGRFAIEFRIGKELLDRVRFDVPLLADPTKRKDRRLGAPEFAVNTRLSARLADSSRATSVVFVDRATGSTQQFAWPPAPDGQLLPITASSAPSSSVIDAGVDAPASDAAATPDAR